VIVGLVPLVEGRVFSPFTHPKTPHMEYLTITTRVPNATPDQAVADIRARVGVQSTS
jgi:hypothetical protein